jgi:hypothetical protein
MKFHTFQPSHDLITGIDNYMYYPTLIQKSGVGIMCVNNVLPKNAKIIVNSNGIEIPLLPQIPIFIKFEHFSLKLNEMFSITKNTDSTVTLGTFDFIIFDSIEEYVQIQPNVKKSFTINVTKHDNLAYPANFYRFNGASNVRIEIVNTDASPISSCFMIQEPTYRDVLGYIVQSAQTDIYTQRRTEAVILSLEKMIIESLQVESVYLSTLSASITGGLLNNNYGYKVTWS